MSIKTISKPIIIGAAATAAAAGIGGYAVHEEKRPPVLDIYVFSLNSGRSIFIRTPEDKRILIDGGSNGDVVRKLTEILPFYSRRIDTLVATNDDAKNISGLIDVAERYEVDRVYVPSVTLGSLGLASSSILLSILEDEAEQKGIQIEEVTASDKFALDAKVQAKALFPVPGVRFKYSKASAPEIALQIRFGATSVTILNSPSEKVQNFIATETAASFQQSDLLILSEGINPDLVSAALIKELSPTYVVYSKNPARPSAVPKTPTKSSLASLLKKKPPADPFASVLPANRLNIKETDTIHFVSDGTMILRK